MYSEVSALSAVAWEGDLQDGSWSKSDVVEDDTEHSGKFAKTSFVECISPFEMGNFR